MATFEANIRGTYHLLDACRVHASMIKAVVVASSDKAYGSSPELPYTEQTPLRARHPYDVSKACTDLLAQTYHDTYGLPVLIARCGNIYGGGDLNWTRIVPGTIRSLLRGERPIIRSDGTFVRDYLYVKDAASAYLCLGEARRHGPLRGEAVNFGGDARRTVLEVVGDLQRLTGRDRSRARHSQHREGGDSRAVAVVRQGHARARVDAGVHDGSGPARDARLVPPLVRRLGACVTACPVCSTTEPAPPSRVTCCRRCRTTCIARRNRHARFRAGSLSLATCRACGFSWNASFDPSRLAYDAGYDNAVPSAVMDRHYHDTALELGRRHSLARGYVVDIGCGNGTFLKALCAGVARVPCARRRSGVAARRGARGRTAHADQGRLCPGAAAGGAVADRVRVTCSSTCRIPVGFRAASCATRSATARHGCAAVRRGARPRLDPRASGVLGFLLRALQLLHAGDAR